MAKWKQNIDPVSSVAFFVLSLYIKIIIRILLIVIIVSIRLIQNPS